jgi:hypothetical protein
MHPQQYNGLGNKRASGNDPRPSLRRDAAGRVYVEYLVLLLIVGIGLIGMAGQVVGARMVTDYSARRALLESTYP